MVLGWWTPGGVSMLKTISVGWGDSTSRRTRSVPWPLPVLLRDPYSTTRKLSASGCSSRKSLAARSGPMVWELEGPFPIL